MAMAAAAAAVAAVAAARATAVTATAATASQDRPPRTLVLRARVRRTGQVEDSPHQLPPLTGGGGTAYSAKSAVYSEWI